MNTSFKLLALVLAIAFTASCKPDDDESCIAGTGGNVTLAAFPKHHSKSVRPYSIWVKYNTKDAPGSTAASYDFTMNADTAKDHVLVPNLKCGDYYIYMNGYDTAIREAVKGGIPFTIGEGTTGQVSFDVPVTE